jgi:hypothetical protein
MGYSATCYSSTANNLDTERVRYAVVDEGLYMTPHFRGYRVKNNLQAQESSTRNLGGMSNLSIGYILKLWGSSVASGDAYKIL